MSAPTPLPSAIIVVEDDLDVRSILSRLLAQYADGYELIAVQHGDDALTALRGRSVPLLITAYQMSGMNGLMLTQVVKVISPRTTVVVCSGYTTDELMQQAFAAGADFYLPKPFPFDQLKAIVKAALE